MTHDAIFLDTRPRPPIALPPRIELNGRFAIGRLLGRPGGFGITYLAVDLRLHRTVAIKEYFPRNLAARNQDGSTLVPQTEDEGEELYFGRERFLHEARTLARFNHPGIVGVQDFFEANGTAYLVMPYYEGQTLEAYVRSRPGGCIDEGTTLSLMLPVLDALHIVHAAGLLHRDLKPENIYLRHPSGQPTLLDFGSAQAEAAQRSRTLERALTPGFAAVEQYITDGEQGAWTDIYGCGATMYRLLTGRTPPEALSRIGTSDPLVPVTALAPHVSKSTAACVAWALQPQGTARPQDARALQAALQAALQEVTVMDGGPGLTVPLQTGLDVTVPLQTGPGVTVPLQTGPGVTVPLQTGAAPGSFDGTQVPEAGGTGDESAAPPQARGAKRRKMAAVAVLAAFVVFAAGAFVLGPRVTLEGAVRDSDGRPLSSVTVELRKTADFDQPRVVRTDADGNFRFRWLPADREYRVSASVDGFHITINNGPVYTGVPVKGMYLNFRARSLAEAFEEYAIKGGVRVASGIDAKDVSEVRQGLDMLNTALEVFPDSAAPRRARIRGRWYAGDHNGCLEDIRKVSSYSGDLEDWCNVGAGNLDQAEAGFKRRASASSSADPHVGLAVIAYRRGSTQAAVRHFADAVRQHAAFASGRDRIEQGTGYLYSPAEWATIEVIHTDYVEAVRAAAASAGSPFFVANRCRHPVRLALRYRRADGEWRTAGWWEFSPNSERTLTFSNAPRPATTNTFWYYYAETTNSANLHWSGTDAFTLQGRTLQMKRMTGTGTVKRWTLTCTN